MSTYPMTTGERVKKSVIDSRTSRAKKQKLAAFLEEHDYYFCETCKAFDGSNGLPPWDCAHLRSVDWCQKNGCVELAWDVENIILECRTHHQQRDGLFLSV